MSTDRVVISADGNPAFAFYLPITALMWREVGCLQPLVIMLGAIPPLVVDRTFAIVPPGDALMMTAPRCCGLAAASQLVRLLAYLAPSVHPDDYLLIGDVDAWPLQAAAFAPPPDDLFLMYDTSTQLDRPGISTPAYPMGYIGAQARLWREFMRVDEATLGLGLERLFASDPILARSPEGLNCDESLITARIKAWPGHPGRCRMIPRDGFPIRGRIDRAAWPADPSAAGMIDAHLVRPGYSDENWPRVRPLLAQTLSPASLAWCDDYRAEWLARMGG